MSRDCTALARTAYGSLPSLVITVLLFSNHRINTYLVVVDHFTVQTEMSEMFLQIKNDMDFIRCRLTLRTTRSVTSSLLPQCLSRRTQENKQDGSERRRTVAGSPSQLVYTLSCPNTAAYTCSLLLPMDVTYCSQFCVLRPLLCVFRGMGSLFWDEKMCMPGVHLHVNSLLGHLYLNGVP